MHSWRPNRWILIPYLLIVFSFFTFCNLVKKIKRGLSWDRISYCFWKVIFKLYPRGRGCANLLFGKLVAENCMKMKEFGSNCMQILFSFPNFWNFVPLFVVFDMHLFSVYLQLFQKFFPTIMYDVIDLSICTGSSERFSWKNIPILLVSHRVNEKNCTCKNYMQRAIVRNWQNKQCSRFSFLRCIFLPPLQNCLICTETSYLLSVTSLYRYNLLKVFGKLGLSVTSILTET